MAQRQQGGPDEQAEDPGGRHAAERSEQGASAASGSHTPRATT